jgi:hypothetical protein
MAARLPNVRRARLRHGDEHMLSPWVSGVLMELDLGWDGDLRRARHLNPRREASRACPLGTNCARSTADEDTPVDF